MRDVRQDLFGTLGTVDPAARRGRPGRRGGAACGGAGRPDARSPGQVTLAALDGVLAAPLTDEAVERVLRSPSAERARSGSSARRCAERSSSARAERTAGRVARPRLARYAVVRARGERGAAASVDRRPRSPGGRRARAGGRPRRGRGRAAATRRVALADGMAEQIAARVLDGPGARAIIELALASERVQAAFATALESEGVERMVARALESPGMDRLIAARVLGEPGASSGSSRRASSRAPASSGSSRRAREPGRGAARRGRRGQPGHGAADRRCGGQPRDRAARDARIVESRLIEQTFMRLLESQELWLLVEEVARSPAVTEADHPAEPRLRRPGRRRGAARGPASGRRLAGARARRMRRRRHGGEGPVGGAADATCMMRVLRDAPRKPTAMAAKRVATRTSRRRARAGGGGRRMRARDGRSQPLAAGPRRSGPAPTRGS